MVGYCLPSFRHHLVSHQDHLSFSLASLTVSVSFRPHHLALFHTLILLPLEASTFYVWVFYHPSTTLVHRLHKYQSYFGYQIAEATVYWPYYKIHITEWSFYSFISLAPRRLPKWVIPLSMAGSPFITRQHLSSPASSPDTYPCPWSLSHKNQICSSQNRFLRTWTALDMVFSQSHSLSISSCLLLTSMIILQHGAPLSLPRGAPLVSPGWAAWVFSLPPCVLRSWHSLCWVVTLYAVWCGFPRL